MVNIIAGVLQRDEAYFGASSTLVKKQFNIDYVDDVIFGWLTPQSDSGVGSPSYVNSIQVATISPASDAKIGIAFWYNDSPNIRHRYFISANSADWKTALSTSTTLNSLTELSVATGSDYTLIP